MRNKFVVGSLVLTMLLAFSTVVLALETPAEIYADIKGIEVEDVDTSTNFVSNLSTEELAKFHTRMIDYKKEWLDTLVAEEKITQERADAILENMKLRQEDCDGTGYNGQGLHMGNGNHRGNGMGLGRGKGRGNGLGRHCN